jgi:hypothetical protein
MSEAPELSPDLSPIVEYKTILKKILDIRPSGTRQRLAAAIGKNRSFISQLANPAYPMPVPAQHIETIFEVCHFSDAERRSFLDYYGLAHPERLKLISERSATRRIVLDVPDFNDPMKNAVVDTLLDSLVRNLSRLIDDPESKS